MRVRERILGQQNGLRATINYNPFLLRRTRAFEFSHDSISGKHSTTYFRSFSRLARVSRCSFAATFSRGIMQICNGYVNSFAAIGLCHSYIFFFRSIVFQ